MLRTFRIVSLVLLLALLANSLPPARPAQARTQASEATQRQPAAIPPTAQPPDPVRTPAQELAAQPAADAHLPSLSLSIAVAPDPLTVGDTATFTITVSNAASDPAEDLAVTLPAPEGAQPLSGSGAQGQGWRWSIGHLDAYASTSVTGALRLTRLPPGAALLMQAQASARGLGLPVQEVGGAIVSERSTGLARASFTPGVAAELRSADSRVQVQFPAGALARPLTLRHTTLADKLAEPGASQDRLPPALAGRSRGLGVFFLNATDASGAEVHQFSAPLTVSARYTPEQLRVRGLTEGNLTLFWFDQAKQSWVPLPSTVDRATRTVRASVDHFTPFQLSDGSSPSEAYLPSLQGFQTSLFTGAATYSYPIDVPAAAGGMKPALTLSYSSAATDGDHPRQKQQAGWVGKGWSLDVGSVSRRKVVINPTTGVFSNTYSLVMDGRSFDLFQGAPLAGNTGADDPDPSHWEWKPADETFDQVRAVANGVSWDRTSTPTNNVTDDVLTDTPSTPNYGHGGIGDGAALPRQAWQLRTKDGTLYEFRGDLWWGWNKDHLCPAKPYEFETYKWLLTRVTDTHGNQITYNYRRQILTGGTRQCDVHTGWATIDRDAWLESITWGKNINVASSADRYKVTFDAPARTNDTQFEGADNQYGSTLGQPRETRRLNRITVWSNSAGTWEQMRAYRLINDDYRLTADTSACPGTCNDTTGTYSPDTAYPKLTLLGVAQVGKDNTTELPATTFTYAYTAAQRGTAYPAAGGFNRLIGVDNGQGGTISIQYQNLVAVYMAQPYHNLFYNRHRVTSRTLSDGRGNSYTWSYSYGQAAMNSLGGAGQPNARPNSAVLYLNKYLDPSNDRRAWLAHKENSEFRGHESVTETLPTGAQIEHKFFQGDAGLSDSGCTITATGSAIYNDACFLKTRDWEILKGREYQTYTRSAPGGTTLSEVRHYWKVDFYSDGGRPQIGLWRSFSYESATEDLSWEGGSTPKVKTTKRYYAPKITDPAIGPTEIYYQSDGLQYGNLTRIEEYDGGVGATTPERITDYYYTTKRDDTQGTYIVDRKWVEQVRDAQRRSLALTQFFYDGANTTPLSVGSRGDLTRVSKYYDVPLLAVLQNQTLHSQDSTFTYDTYGNRLTETTYASPGSRLVSGTTWTISAPGGGGAARTTSTIYDNPATAGVDEANSGLAIQVTQPPAQTGATPLVESAGYDYRMGTMTSVTDANGNLTSATYDVFGRMSTLVKPGDSTAYPTVRVVYDNYNASGRSGQPFTFTIYQREVANLSGERITQQYYDGMGRQIQTKTESSDGGTYLVNTVVDTRYDGLGQATQTSQARYMAETSGSFYLYTPVPASGMLWTSTTYDALGRPKQITQPDGTKTTTSYGLGSLGGVTSTIDANSHRTNTEYDVFGRRRTVTEYKGIGTVDDLYRADATTSYTYSPLDLLTSVTDAAGNSTTITYDTLGRKTGMRDPDMGTWSYGYDVNGNLTQQTDAKGQTATFTYDALNRQTGATYPDQRVMAWAYDEAVPNGRGQRTSSAVWESGAQKLYMVWHYDARGNQSLQRYNLPGGMTRDFCWLYDSADRLVQLTYPPLGGVTETLTYSYDAGWRQTSVCTSRGGCYAGGATYSALDQPKQWTFGNGLQQTWVYDSPMQRLNAIRLSNGGPDSLAFFTYGPYDGAGNLKAVLDRLAAQTQTFTYDHRDRLASATTQSGVIRVQARGDYAGGAWPEMEVRVNGQLKQSFTVSSGSWSTYSVDTGAPLQPSDRIDVVFTNDYYAEGVADRNLYVDWVQIGEQTVQAESGSVIYDTGAGSAAFDGLNTLPGQEMVNGYGALRFQAGKEITVRARGDYAGGAWPAMDVRVNGTVVQSFTVGSGSWADYRVVLSTPLALDDQVDVAFTNDYSDSTSDRNLSVDSVQMAGQTIRPQSDAVTYDTGAGAAAFDGQSVYPGLRQPHSGGLMAWYGALRMRARMSYTYDTVGNLTSNAGLALSYPAGGASSVRPHAPTAVGGFSYSYDANGNMLSGVSQTLTWTAQNLPASITGPDGATETYGYDDGGERLTTTRGGQTTFYLAGLWEETSGGSTRVAYTFNGALVAQRDSSAGVTYLHGDSLGSVSIASDAAGAVVSRQAFTPWGAVRSGGIGQTSYSYTGQRLDQTGLLYYHARMYDPVIGRFLSPDSVVPSSASGGMDGVALKPLTVDFHEPGFISALNGENRQPFWFQMSSQQRRQAGSPWGPANPQALNRYSYVQNNPLKYTDPSGHTWYLSKADAKALSTALRRLAGEIKSGSFFAGSVTGLIQKAWAVSGLSANALSGNFYRAIMTGLAEAAIAVVIAGVGIGVGFSAYVAEDLTNMANRIDDYTGDKDGIAIATDDHGVYFLNRTTGSAIYWESGVSASGSWLLGQLPASMRLGAEPVGEASWWEKWHFAQDEQWAPTNPTHP